MPVVSGVLEAQSQCYTATCVHVRVRVLVRPWVVHIVTRSGLRPDDDCRAELALEVGKFFFWWPAARRSAVCTLVVTRPCNEDRQPPAMPNPYVPADTGMAKHTFGTLLLPHPITC